MIYNKLFSICLFILLGFCCLNCSAVAIPVSSEEQSLCIDYTKFPTSELKILAENNFGNALKESDKVKKENYLKSASVQYSILAKINPDDIDNYIKLGRIYDMRSLDKLAKANFSNALGIDIKNTMANYYFAQFYYDRKNYKKALFYYHKAFENGYKQDFETLKKVGYIYEQYGDLQRAILYYKKCNKIKSDLELNKKIQEIEGLNYSSTGYDKKKIRRIKDETN